ncbi:MAG: serine/threonine-protein kinase [Planctomycetota bacterium]
MMANQLEEEIFQEAIAISDKESRIAFLRENSGLDADQVEHLCKLVDSHFAAGDFMLLPAQSLWPEVAEAETGQFQPNDGPNVGEHLGEFELLRELGRGASGIVFEGLQRDPVERRVAIKVLFGCNETSVARMHLERQLLASMDHEGIARFLDAGITPGGAPFFVMELVQGQSIAEYVQDLACGQREIAALIRSAAAAISYAHTKGVIHRDLKPSNMLVVGDSEIEARCKIIDFGIAKIVRFDQSERMDTLTSAGQLIGTPQYMSPEQATLDPERVDTRSDVYSLGAVFYELLTGATPFQSEFLLKTLNQIIQEEPASPTKKNPEVKRDLATICLKCLEKKPENRYPSADALVQDLDCFLEGRTISARKVTTHERLVRWGRRNPAIAGLSLVVLVTLAWSLWSWYAFTAELKQQRDQTQALAREMRVQRDQAVDNFKRAHQAIQNSLSIRSHTPMGSSKNLLVQKQILEAGLQYYDDLLTPMRRQESLVSTQEYWLAHRERAQLHHEFGKVVLGARDNQRAAESFRKAIRACSEILDNLGQSEESKELKEIKESVQRLRGVCFTSLFKTLERMQDWPAAIDAAESGLQCYRELDASGALRGDYRHWFYALSWQRIAIAQLERNNLEAAEAGIENAISHARQLSSVPDFQLTMSEVLLLKAMYEQRIDLWPRSLDTIEEALSIARKTSVSSVPPTPRYDRARIACVAAKARCLEHLRRVSEAQASAQQAVELQRALASRHADFEQFTLELAGLLEEFASLVADEQSEAWKSEASTLRKELTAKLEQPEELLINARLQIEQAWYDYLQIRPLAAISILEESRRLLLQIPNEYGEGQQVSELLRGVELKLALINFEALRFEKAVQHFEIIVSEDKELLADLSVPFAVSLAECGRISDAAQYQHANEGMVTDNWIGFQPLLTLLFVLEGTRASGVSDLEEERAPISRSEMAKLGSDLDAALQAFRDMERDPALTALQSYNFAFALCRARELLRESTLPVSKTKEFSDWAEQCALRLIAAHDRQGKNGLRLRLIRDQRLKNLSEAVSGISDDRPSR